MPQMGLGQGMYQELHHALWSTYMRGPGKADDSEFGPDPLDEALESLADLWKQVVRHGEAVGPTLKLVGTALWDLLDDYRSAPPPKRFSELLLEVLTLDLDRARELRGLPPHQVFPPLPETFAEPDEGFDLWGAARLMAESSFAIGVARKRPGTRVSIQVNVASDFDELARVVDPFSWTEACPTFWADMKEDDGHLIGGLRLPGVSEAEIIDVRLKTTRAKVDSARNDADVDIVPNPWIERAHFAFRMSPVPSRPGWTRIKHEREIALTQKLRPYEAATLRYWTKSEIACLVLA
jgi:hypothetical protein